MDLDLLPDELLVESMVSKLSIQDLLRLCRSSSRFNRLCQDDYVWKILFIRDFGQPKKFKGTWKETYISQYRHIKEIERLADSIVDKIITNEYPEDWGVGVRLFDVDLNLLPFSKRMLDEIYSFEGNFQLDPDPQLIMRYDNGLSVIFLTIEFYDVPQGFPHPRGTGITTHISKEELRNLIFNLVRDNVNLYDVYNDPIYSSEYEEFILEED